MVAKSWDEMESLDDAVTEEERKLNARIVKKVKVYCPFLRKDGEHFYYCGVNIPNFAKPKMSPTDPIYKARLSSSDMQLYCMVNHQSCHTYHENTPEAVKRPE